MASTRVPAAHTHSCDTYNKLDMFSFFFFFISFIVVVRSGCRVHMTWTMNGSQRLVQACYGRTQEKKRTNWIKVVSHDSLIYSFISFRHTEKTKRRRKKKKKNSNSVENTKLKFYAKCFSYILNNFCYLLSYATHTIHGISLNFKLNVLHTNSIADDISPLTAHCVCNQSCQFKSKNKF